ncbi:MAG: hypothetical protein FJ190_03800 [Gammaproteobacteria bacterium]|nr:hypothetical protein [Gammaproteobacteria bacterium]
MDTRFIHKVTTQQHKITAIQALKFIRRFNIAFPIVAAPFLKHEGIKPALDQFQSTKLPEDAIDEAIAWLKELPDD